MQTLKSLSNRLRLLRQSSWAAMCRAVALFLIAQCVGMTAGSRLLFAQTRAGRDGGSGSRMETTALIGQDILDARNNRQMCHARNWAKGKDPDCRVKKPKGNAIVCPNGSKLSGGISTTATIVHEACRTPEQDKALWLWFRELNCGETGIAVFSELVSWGDGAIWKNGKCESFEYCRKKINGEWVDLPMKECR